MLLSNEIGTWSIGKLARAKTLSAAMGCDYFLVTPIVTSEHSNLLNMFIKQYFML
jgi:hypothetical protein